MPGSACARLVPNRLAFRCFCQCLIEHIRVGTDPHATFQAGETAHELSRDLDEAGSGQHSDTSQNRPVAVQPPRPVAADFNGCAAHIAGIDKKLYALRTTDSIVERSHGRVAKFAHVGAANLQDHNPIRRPLDRKAAMDSIESFFVSAWRHSFPRTATPI